jgi:L-seryl-tRNA(Ser) seleniumtransferase
MRDAAASFVDLHDLQRRVGDKIAELTGNDACYVSSGAAAGLVLAAASCITGANPDLVQRFPDLTGLKNEIIVHKTHRNGYDYAVRQTGARGIPVVVDAAAQLPPVENLWRFTQMGAALVVFSGGKDLRGPQSSGLVLGRRDLIEACRMHGAPNQAIGRPMKVGKEEMMGLLAAVTRYVRLDHEERREQCEAVVAGWCSAFSAVPGVSAQRTFPNEAGQPLPRCLVHVESDRNAVVEALAAGSPSIIVESVGESDLHLNPMTLEPGEAEIIRKRLLEILAARS